MTTTTTCKRLHSKIMVENFPPVQLDLRAFVILSSLLKFIAFLSYSRLPGIGGGTHLRQRNKSQPTISTLVHFALYKFTVKYPQILTEIKMFRRNYFNLLNIV